MYILRTLVIGLLLAACAPDHIVLPPDPLVPVDVQAELAAPADAAAPDAGSDGTPAESGAEEVSTPADSADSPDAAPDVQRADASSHADTAAADVQPDTSDGTCGSSADCPAFPQWRCGTTTGRPRCACTAAPPSTACGGQDTDCDGREDPFQRCSGVCSDPRTDTMNCGRCGNTCARGEVCLSSSCACPAFADNASRCLFCVRNCLGTGAHSACCTEACAATSRC